ncbi:hypothetical protein IIK97_004051 [Salmonella enterica subsp. enterica serovar Nigeria]|nr:hypothetical protein [Salmonella enterica subsp. enterica serovar Nigeria]
MTDENDEGQLQTRMDLKREMQQAAKYRYESDPQASMQTVADEFGVSLATIKNWAHDHTWVKAHKLTGTPVQTKYRNMIRRSVKKNKGEVLTDEQVQTIALEHYYEERSRMADLQTTEMIKMALLSASARRQKDDRELDRLLKETVIKEKAFKIIAKRWRLDEGLSPFVDGFTSLEDLLKR